MLADKFNTLQMGLVAAERVFKLVENDAVIKDDGNIEVDQIEGKVEFENVSFAYDEENLVLRDISFKLNPGDTLAIVGSTGSGKTSIINILNRFYDIQGGVIRLDDVDIKDYKLKSIRDRVAMVLQDVFLFNGTVLDNIRLRDDSITKEQIIEASKIIGAHPFLENLPDGYDFMITERGSNLSMGQRQLISFIRALVFNPNILVLDEATSSIDSETETIIQYAIEKLIQKRTSIIIAHRLSTIRHADKIIVLDNGRIMEQGSHQELLLLEDGHYRNLYEKQFEQNSVL
jgi:ATP-binding cassette subfamily B protein